jgi:hypothetical protein
MAGPRLRQSSRPERGDGHSLPLAGWVVAAVARLNRLTRWADPGGVGERVRRLVPVAAMARGRRPAYS